MTGSANLWLYFVVVFGVIALPGMDMAFVMGSSMVAGRRAGLAAVAGVVAGGVCHTVIGASGVGALLRLVPSACTAMLAAGAAYIAWTGYSLLRAGDVKAPQLQLVRRSPRQSFFGAIATCLLNPKAYLFMLAIFPQFIHAENGAIWVQAAWLGLITAATQATVYGAVALASAHLQSGVAARPQANARIVQSVGLVLIAAAALTLYSGLRFHP
jgi:threonine/homoserine/homoserine lactone efflux protein